MLYPFQPHNDPPLFPAMEHSIEEIVEKQTAELQQKYDDLVRAGVKHAEEEAGMIVQHRREVCRLHGIIDALWKLVRRHRPAIFVIYAHDYEDTHICPIAFVTRELAEEHVQVWRLAIEDSHHTYIYDVIPVKL